MVIGAIGVRQSGRRNVNWFGTPLLNRYDHLIGSPVIVPRVGDLIAALVADLHVVRAGHVGPDARQFLMFS